MELASTFNDMALMSVHAPIADTTPDHVYSDTALALTAFDTAATPDQVTWSSDRKSFFYSVRTYRGELPLTESQRGAVAPLAKGFAFPDYALSIRCFDVDTCEDRLIYSAPENTFAISHLCAPPDGDELVFARIPNVMQWVEALENGRLEPFANLVEHCSAVPVEIYHLSLSDGAVTCSTLADTKQLRSATKIIA
ncbi:MAG: hypothetical protein K8L99_24395 [Anaerolineae bacterium]|nr:hypothetical protein [Anaerolineae bacterium]